ncbi:MAG: hypothetical protein ACREJ7_00320, partial [Candidatus Methylomirabilales bacterium]
MLERFGHGSSLKENVSVSSPVREDILLRERPRCAEIHAQRCLDGTARSPVEIPMGEAMGRVEPDHRLPVVSDQKLHLHREGGNLPTLCPMPATHSDPNVEIQDELFFGHPRGSLGK